MAVITLWPTGANADNKDPQKVVGAYVTNNGELGATARDGGLRSVQASTESATTWVCETRVANPDDRAYPIFNPDGERWFSDTGRWLIEQCRDTASDQAPPAPVTYPEQRSEAEQLAREALDSIQIPVPAMATSPPAGSMVVRIPTWLAMDPGWWHPYEATATAGDVSSTAVATPTRVTWSTGDGGQVVCDGPGTPWSSGKSEHDTSCSYTYTRSSEPQATGTFQMDATVDFDVAWTSNVGEQGSLGSISRSASQPVRVGEVQAIRTR